MKNQPPPGNPSSHHPLDVLSLHMLLGLYRYVLLAPLCDYQLPTIDEQYFVIISCCIANAVQGTL